MDYISKQESLQASIQSLLAAEATILHVISSLTLSEIQNPMEDEHLAQKVIAVQHGLEQVKLAIVDTTNDLINLRYHGPLRLQYF